MLQIYNSPSGQVEEGTSTRDVPSSAELSLADLFTKAIGFIRRRFLVILSVVPLTVGLAAVYIFTTPPLYSAHARIMIDTGKVQLFKQAILGDDPVNSAMVDSQLEILRSDNFLLSIVKNLRLTQDPEFVEPKESLIDSAKNSILYRLHLLLHPSASLNRSESEFAQGVLLAFKNRLTLNRVGLTFIIEIGFQSSDPDHAAKIANAVADAFIVDQLESKYQTIGKATTWLQDRLNDLRAQASVAERAVVEYKTKNNIVDTGGHLINEQQVAELNTALLKARADTVEAKARLDRVSQIIRSDDLDPAEMATVTETLNNQVISKLREQYLGLTQREALLSNQLGSNHLAVVNLRNQAREVRRSIVDQMKQIAEAYKSDYDIAKARENSLEKNLASTVVGSQTANRAQIELRQLESAAQSYRALYDNFQQRYTDSVQQQSFPMAEVRVISSASRPSEKSSPKSFRVLAVGVVGGLALGFGIAMLLEISDRVFRTSRQVEAKLQAECMAMVPMIGPSVKAAAVSNKAAADPAAPRIIAPNVGLFRHVVDLPLSPFAELIRAVKVGADLSRLAKSNKVIGITSSVPGEGKSTIAASLAQISAHGGARTILVDCDLRRPSLSPELARNATVGLVEVIAGTAGLEDVIWSDPATQLSFLPAVVRSRMTHTSEILASDATKRFFDHLREKYDYVIVDLSPLAPVVDVRSTAHFIDCYLFVIEWGKTKISVVEQALSTARVVYDNLLGVVLNKVDFTRLGSYESNRGQSYYNSYYGHYGYTSRD